MKASAAAEQLPSFNFYIQRVLRFIKEHSAVVDESIRRGGTTTFL
jgi:hypothetical protein